MILELHSYQLTSILFSFSSQIKSYTLCGSCIEDHPCLVALSLLLLLVLGTLMLIIGTVIIVTLPGLPSGNITVGHPQGHPDVVLVSTLDSSVISELELTVDHSVNVSVYQGLCSEIQDPLQVFSSSTLLNVADNNQYRIDELYLMEGLQANYTFSATTGLESSAVCVYVFAEYSHYFQFVLTGFATRVLLSECLPPNSTESLNISLESSKNQYFFVGLESHVSTIINYTVARDTMEYNVSNLTPTSCVFSVPSSVKCSIPLENYPGGQKVCSLAILQEEDAFIAMAYSSRSL